MKDELAKAFIFFIFKWPLVQNLVLISILSFNCHVHFVTIKKISKKILALFLSILFSQLRSASESKVQTCYSMIISVSIAVSAAPVYTTEHFGFKPISINSILMASIHG